MIRKRLPDTRPSVTRRVNVDKLDLYITLGFYDNDQPGEVFVVIGKEGSVISGLVDSLATSLSLLLQVGVPLERAVSKLKHSRFEPSCEEYSSIVDAIAKTTLALVSQRGGHVDRDYDQKEVEW